MLHLLSEKYCPTCRAEYKPVYNAEGTAIMEVDCSEYCTDKINLRAKHAAAILKYPTPTITDVRRINSNNNKSHLEVMSEIYGERFSGFTFAVAVLLFDIEGVGEETAKQIGVQYKNADEFLNDFTNQYLQKLSPARIEEFRTWIPKLATKVKVEHRIDTNINLYLTSRPVIGGIAYDKDVFIASLNKTLEPMNVRLIHLKNISKTKKVDYCIAQDVNTGTRKANDARERGIPIVTGDQFVAELQNLLAK